MNWTNILFLIGSSGLGGLAVAVIPKIVDFVSSKPKNDAEAEKLRAEATATFADGWHNLYKEVITQNQVMNKRIDEMEVIIKQQQQNHQDNLAQIREKDEKIKHLEERVNYLENELKKYKKIETEV